MERGLYIHVPFCIKKCNYCDFNSFKFNSKEKDIYIESLIKEMKLYSKSLKENDFDTVFVGGGTPTVLSGDELEYLFENIYSNFNIKKNAEISIESNPGTLDKNKLKKLYDIGVNRISMGLQACQQKHLEFLGRIHTYEEFEKNFKEAKEVGFNNINVDLMFSLPNQTFNEWKETLNNIIKLNPTHISAYSLILEEGTKFYDMYEDGNLSLLNEEEDLNMYHYAIDFLKENGYFQYEISNFSKKGYECEHNVIYWKCSEYLGLGPGSHSYLDGNRFNNYKNIKEYSNSLSEDKMPIEDKEILSKKEKIEEKIFMGLRMNKGICFDDFSNEFNIDFIKKYGHVLDKLKSHNLVDYNETGIYLTDKGRDLSNTVFVEFLGD